MRMRAPRAAAAAAGATAALMLASAPAQASFMEFSGSWSSGAQFFNIRETPGDYGAASWTPDPIGDDPGDTLCVNDFKSDGRYITAELYGTSIKVSTNGKTAPSQDCMTYNLPEGSKYSLRMCVRGKSDDHCSKWYLVND